MVVGSPLRAALHGLVGAGGTTGPAAGPAPRIAAMPSSAGAPVTASGTAAAPASGAAPTVGQPGWRLAFRDDFDGTELGGDWFAYTGQPENDPGGYFAPSHVSVGGGRLTIGAWREAARQNRYVTGGISVQRSLAQKYGRFDIRFRMQRGHGISYALLLWPATNSFPPEIDIAEDNGRDRTVMYATLHPPGRGQPSERSVAGDFTQWHTAGLQWTPGLLALTLDGREWARFAGASVPAQPMTLAVQTQSWFCGRSWEACPDSSTPARVNLLVDWVAQYEWRP